MKSSVAVALIVCGTILIALPYVNNTLGMRQVVQTMVVLNKSINLNADLPRYADRTCIIGGLAMIIVGTSFGLRRDQV